MVTAADSNGFYLQDPAGPDAEGYVDGASSGIYVFTGAAPATRWSLVRGRASTAPCRSSGPDQPGSTITELTDTDHDRASTDRTTDPHAPTVVGGAGLQVPSTVIDNDAAPGKQVDVETGGQYQPGEDGIDFWESLEGMASSSRRPRGRPDQRDVRRDADGPGRMPAPRPTRGGIVLLQGDPNPERIFLDNELGTVMPEGQHR